MSLRFPLLFRYTLYGLAIIAGLHSASTTTADEPAPRPINHLPNLAAPTWGGTQFWTDEMVCRGWRIQRNALTGHCRLLDDDNYRRAWGSYDACWQRFEKHRADGKIEPVEGKVVILLHGLGGWRSLMNDTGEHLAEHVNYTPVNVSYASTRGSLDEHARSLAKVIAALDQAERIDFVAHSLGNLVVRRYLALAAETPAGVDPRIQRMVMLAPPNQGASLARHFRDLDLYSTLLGPSGEQLLEDPAAIQTSLATPPFEFAILAGTGGINPLIDSPNDFTVTVEETRLAGARDFHTLPLHHARFRDNEECLKCVARFLEKGYLVSAEERTPLEGEVQRSDRTAVPLPR